MIDYKVGDMVRILHTDYENEGLDVGDIREVKDVFLRGVELESEDFELLYFRYDEVELVQMQKTVDYNDGNWHGWNGGGCPVHPESVVRVCGEFETPYETIAGGDVYWPNVIAFRVIEPYRKLREGYIASTIFSTAREAKIAYPGCNPIRVREVIE